MKFTNEQLMTMPLKHLRGLDIQNVDDEKLVQEILNTRMKGMPNVVTFNIPSSITDNLTVETEKELQAKLDVARAKRQAIILSEEEETTTPEVEEEDVPLMPETTEPAAEETTPEVPTEPVVEPEAPSQPEVVGKFCDYCDSLGGRHKRVCTRPGKPTI